MKAPNYEQMQDMFRAHTEAALKVIVEIMTGSGGKGDAVRLSAAKEILSRAWGKPPAQKAQEKKKDKDWPAPAEAPVDKAAADADNGAPPRSAPSLSTTAKPAAAGPTPWFRSSSPTAKSTARPAASS